MQALHYSSCKVYGQAKVYDEETKKYVVVIILKTTKDECGFRYLRAKIVDQQKQLIVGEVKYTKIADRLGHSKRFGCENFAAETGLHSRYGNAKKDLEMKVPKIYVIKIVSFANERYKGVGTKLMQAIFEISLQDKNGSNGRIQLDATGSHEFYYEAVHMRAMQGLEIFDEYDGGGDRRLCPKEVDELIARNIELAKLTGRRARNISSLQELGCFHMYLPKDGIHTWTQTISVDPILYKTRIIKVI